MSPNEPPQSDRESPQDDAAFAEAIHGELIRARIPQVGCGGCLSLAGFVPLGFGVLGVVLAFMRGADSFDLGRAASIGLCYASSGLVVLIPGVLLLNAAKSLGGIGDGREQILTSMRFQRQFWQASVAMLALFVGLCCALQIVVLLWLSSSE